MREELLSKDSIIKLLINDRNKSIDTKPIEVANHLPNHIANRNDANRAKSLNLVVKDTRKKDKAGDTRKKTEDDFNTQKKNKNNIRTITIIGDSIIKDVKGYEIKKDLPRNNRVFVRPNSGATTEDMGDYVKPSKKFNSDLYILHCGTNDLRTGKDAEKIADEMINLALGLKLDENEVAISSIVTRNDDLNDKADKVNYFLNIKANACNLGFIDNANISKIHLNNSNLHLTTRGAKLLAKNIVDFIKL